MKGVLTELIVVTIILVVILVIIGSMGVDTTHAKQEKGMPTFEAVSEGTNYYALTGKVVGINLQKNVVTVADYNGNLWEFSGVEDWEIEDGVSMLMNDMGTSSVYDDEIEGVHYTAWTLTR